jgi:hypothetical protein
MKLSFALVFLLQSILALYPSTVWAVSEYPNCDSTTEDKDDAGHRCVLKAQAADLRTSMQQCKDITNEDEKKECLLKNAAYRDSEGTTQSTNQDSSKKGARDAAITLAAIQTAFSIGNIAFHEKGSCQQWSWVFMNLAGIASAVGELVAFFGVYLPKSKELNTEFENIAKDPELSGAQKKAFEFLKKEQEMKASTDTARAITYTVSTALYGTAVGFAIYELVLSKSNAASAAKSLAENGTCQSDSQKNAFYNKPLFKILAIASGLVPIFTRIYEKSDQDKNKHSVKMWLQKDLKDLKQLLESPIENTIAENDLEKSWFSETASSTSITEYQEVKKFDNTNVQMISLFISKVLDQLIIKDAQAQVSPNSPDFPAYLARLNNNAQASAKIEAIKKSTGKLKKFMASPIMRLLGSGTMFGLGLGITITTYKQAEEHRNRAAVYDKLMKLLPTDDAEIGICTAEDRKDASKPNCYCYIDMQGAEAPNPATANTDICKQKLGQYKIGDYEGTDKKTDGKVCFKKDGNIDFECRCKQQKDKDGQNGCMKAQKGFAVNGGLGFTNMSNAGMNGFSQIASGNLSGAGVSGGTLTQGLSSINTMKKKANALLKKNGVAPIDFAGLEKSAKAEMLQNAAQVVNSNGLANGPFNGGSSFSSLDPKLAAKLEKTAKENGVSDIKFNTPVAAAATKKDGFDLTDLSGESGSGEVIDLAGTEEVMQKNFNFGSNDISKNSSENLFKMISNRYLVSGLKRLFEEMKTEESKPTPLSPSKTEEKPVTP